MTPETMTPNNTTPNTMTPDLKIALITDVHHGPAFEVKAGPLANGILASLLGEIERSDADLLIDLGDRINNDTVNEDRANMRLVASTFQRLALEHHHLLGNHDVKLLSPRDNAELMGAPVGNRVLRRGDWNLLLWSPPPLYTIRGCEVPESDVAWLADALKALDRPTVLFTHVPLVGSSMEGNYYFEGATAAGASYRNVEPLRDLVLESGYVRLAVAGHVHWNSLVTIDGVPFLSVQSMSEITAVSPLPVAAWSELHLRAQEATLTVHGSDPWRVTVPLHPVGFRALRRPGLPARGGRTARADLANVRGVILDLDGVMYRGSELLDGADAFLELARSSGRRLVAVTNHSGASARDVRQKLQTMGISLAPDEILTSIDAVMAYLQDRRPTASVLPLGSPALAAGLAEAGFRMSEKPDVVVAGFQERLDAEAMLAAARAIDAGADLVATNTDSWLPTTTGRTLEAGGFVAMLSAISGLQPTVVGKPTVPMAELALKRLGMTADVVLVIGDTLSTDIATAKAIGAASALVLTGNTAADDVLLPRPDWVFEDLHELTAALSATAQGT